MLDINPKLIEEDKTKEGLLLHLENSEMKTLEERISELERLIEGIDGEQDD